MRVSVRLFAMLREIVGSDRLELDLPDGARVADVLAALPPHAARMPLVAAVNLEYVPPETVLRADDEIALVPPVSGGASVYVTITSTALDVGALLARVSDPAAGAVVLFLGVTRTVERLDYDAYVAMAQPLLEQIACEALREHGLCSAAIAHRIGAVPLSEPSVAVAASSPHRPAAFAGARAMIDAVKERAPIWKRELDGGEARWVAGQPPVMGAS